MRVLPLLLSAAFCLELIIPGLTSFAAELPDDMLLEDVPIGSEIQVTKEISVSATGATFQVFFSDGRIFWSGNSGDSKAQASGVEIQRSSERKFIQAGYCSLFDNVSDYENPEGERLRIPTGLLFTVRGRGYEFEKLSPDDPLTQGELVLYNTSTFVRTRAPTLACRNANHRKPTVGDLRSITSGVFTIVSPPYDAPALQKGAEHL